MKSAEFSSDCTGQTLVLSQSSLLALGQLLSYTTSSSHDIYAYDNK